MFTAKAMQEHKSFEESRETSANSKIVAFNRYKKINDTFPDTVKFLSKVLSKRGIKDLSLQLAIITYLKEYLFELKGYCTTQGFFKFTTGHQIALMTKNGLINHIKGLENDLENEDVTHISINFNEHDSYNTTIYNFIHSMLDSIDKKREIGTRFVMFGLENAYKRIKIDFGYSKVPGKLIPFRMVPTQKFTLDIDRSSYIVLEEDLNSTFRCSLLDQWISNVKSRINNRDFLKVINLVNFIVILYCGIKMLKMHKKIKQIQLWKI